MVSSFHGGIASMLHVALALGWVQIGPGPLGKEGNRKKSRRWQGPKARGWLSCSSRMPRRLRTLIHGSGGRWENTVSDSLSAVVMTWTYAPQEMGPLLLFGMETAIGTSNSVEQTWFIDVPIPQLLLFLYVGFACCVSQKPSDLGPNASPPFGPAASPGLWNMAINSACTSSTRSPL